MLTFKHSGNLGDVVYSLPTVRALLARHDLDGAGFYLNPGVPSPYPCGPHPLGNVRLDAGYASDLFPLLRAQPWITEAGLWDGSPVSYDLDRFRETGYPFSRGDIARYYCHAFPVSPNLSDPWLDVDPAPDFAGAILVNRTQRYRNPAINYRFLSNRADVVFVGLPQEHAEFSREAKHIRHEVAPDFLTLARWLKGCRLFVGNQSFAFALAEALKIPRILEIFPTAPNVIPHGPNGWDAYSQPLLEEIFALLA